MGAKWFMAIAWSRSCLGLLDASFSKSLYYT
jgi:hypothetical protein